MAQCDLRSLVFVGSASIALSIVQKFSLINYAMMRHSEILRIRFPRIVSAEAVVAFFVLLLLFPAWYFNICREPLLWGHSEWSPQKVLRRTMAQQLIDVVLWEAVTTAAYFMSHIEALRLWLIYYEVMLLEAFRDKTWGSQITSNFWRTNFYLRHRSSRGNIGWVSTRVLVYWATVSAVSVTVHFNVVRSEESSAALALAVHLLEGLVFLLPIAFIALLSWKMQISTTSQVDNMMLKDEFVGLCWVWAIATFGFFGTVCLMSLGLRSAALTSVAVVLVFTVSAPSLFSTLWIPLRIRRKKKRSGTAKANVRCIEFGIFRDRKRKRNGEMARGILEELAILLMDGEKMKAMMRWMMADFSVESFLCFVELVQFKENVVALLERQNPSFAEQEVVGKRYKLHEHCPQSSIVFGASNGNERDLAALATMVTVEEENGSDAPGDGATRCRESAVELAMFRSITGNVERKESDALQLDQESVSRLKGSAHLLWKKYLKNGAPLEINIGYEMKRHFDALEALGYGPLRPIEWVTLYDALLFETERFILQSYERMIIYLDTQENEARTSRSPSN